jgi:hypothetical protein
VTNPNFNQRQSDPGDLAVIRFKRDLPPTPAALPRGGLFDQMKAAGTLNGRASPPSATASTSRRSPP